MAKRRPKISIILTLTLAWFALGLIWTAGVYLLGMNLETAIFVKHIPAAIGIPSAAVVAFTLVALLDRAAGPLEFSIFGIKLKGSAAEWFVWVICFLVIVLAIKVLW